MHKVKDQSQESIERLKAFPVNQIHQGHAYAAFTM